MPDRAIDVGWAAPDETECVVRLRYSPGEPANRDPGGNFIDPPQDAEVEILSVTDEQGVDRPDLAELAQADLDLVGKAEEKLRDTDAAAEEDRRHAEREQRRTGVHRG